MSDFLSWVFNPNAYGQNRIDKAIEEGRKSSTPNSDAIYAVIHQQLETLPIDVRAQKNHIVIEIASSLNEAILLEEALNGRISSEGYSIFGYKTRVIPDAEMEDKVCRVVYAPPVQPYDIVLPTDED